MSKVRERPASQSQRPARPASKELIEFGRNFKQGYRWERSGGGHWRIRDREGKLVEFRGRPITTSGNPSSGVLRALEEQLIEAHVLKGTKVRISDESVKRRIEANRRIVRERTAARQLVANALHERYKRAFEAMGGLDVPGLAADLGHVAAIILREMPSTNGDERRAQKTPDLLAMSAFRLLHSAWVEDDYRVIWEALASRLESAPDHVGEWYTLVREARGLPADTVQLRLPKGTEDDWPFRVELLPLDALFVDMAYQRPVAWPFVRREAARFDPSLVGTIDVAQRSPSSFAILDGQQRMQIVRLVGKQTIFASIYVGLDLPSEARFFLHKNRDRKIVHPFYTFRAMMASNDEGALAANAIVERYGYKLTTGAPLSANSTSIAAISAVQTAYGRKLPDGTDTLDPTLSVLSRSTRGRQRGQDSMLIRGVSSALVERPDVDLDVLVDVLAAIGPDLLLGRARDLKRTAHVTGEQAVVTVILMEHDTRIKRAKRAGAKAAA